MAYHRKCQRHHATQIITAGRGTVAITARAGSALGWLIQAPGCKVLLQTEAGLCAMLPLGLTGHFQPLNHS